VIQVNQAEIPYPVWSTEEIKNTKYIDFFTKAIGDTLAQSAAAITDIDTNIVDGSKLPEPTKDLLVNSIQLIVHDANGTTNDTAKVIANAVKHSTIALMESNRTPFKDLTRKCWVNWGMSMVDTDVDGDVSYILQGDVKDDGLILPSPILIPGGHTFWARLEFPAALSTLTDAHKITCRLGGVLVAKARVAA